MPRHAFVRYVTIALLSLIGLSLSGCVVTPRPYGYVRTAPPPAVAYYDYWYYPSVQVYFDVNRGLYFYLTSNRGWVETRSLPPALRVRLGGYVPIHSRFRQPYREHGEHRRAYPPQYRVDRYPPERHDGDRVPYPNYQPAPPQKEPPRTWRELNERQENQVQRRDERRDERQDYRNAPGRDERDSHQRNEAPRKYPIKGKSETTHDNGKTKNKGKDKGKQKKSGKDKKREDAQDKSRGKSERDEDRSDKDTRDWNRRNRDDNTR